jgi:hypothetical protein
MFLFSPLFVLVFFGVLFQSVINAVGVVPITWFVITLAIAPLAGALYARLVGKMAMWLGNKLPE